jgi:hypothetical protein
MFRHFLALILTLVGTIALAAPGGRAEAATPCFAEPAIPSLELVYSLRAGKEKAERVPKPREPCLGDGPIEQGAQQEAE